MLDIAFSIIVIVAIAWIGRMFLDAREVGWGWLLLASLVGIGVGDAAALFLLAEDISEVASIDYTQLQAVSMPFRVVATMGAIVVLELLFRRSRNRPAERGRPRRRILGPAAMLRALQILRIFTRHGLAPLTNWGGRRSDALDLARRARKACEEAGGVFIKLGQLMATRPDLLPPEAMNELARLQSAVTPLPRDAMEAQLRAQLSKPLEEVFSSVDWDPLGSASIAQAHAAVLLNGAAVVVKVRRPGLEKVMLRDLAILEWLGRTAQRRFAWARKLGLNDLIAEFADVLVAELDLSAEAGNFAEVSKAVAGESMIHVPRVYSEFTRPGLIVMERLAGIPLGQLPEKANIHNSERLADALCFSQVRSMLEGERFHGDPHAGNVMVLKSGRLGLIDLGISSKLDVFERAAVMQILLALKQQQPGLLYESMVTIGAVDQSLHDPETIERALARFMAAYLGPGLPPASALTDLLRLTLDLGLHLPPSTTAMFRALATLMGTLEQLHPGYPVIDKVTQFGGSESRRRFMPATAIEFIRQEWSELGPILLRLPRHVDRLATMVEHGRLTTSIRILADREDRRFIEKLVNRFVFTFLSIGVGAVSVMLLNAPGGFQFPWFDVGLYQVLGWIGLFIAMTLMFRVLLAVVSSDDGVG